MRSAARYNNGAPAPVVTLQPAGGIVLERVPGELDGDGDVDFDDFVVLAGCVTGPDVLYSGGCELADLDYDDDVDLVDLALFQQAFTGSGG